MGTVSPSKFLSLEYLKALKNTWYTGKNGKEYCQYEVEQLIWEKENNLKVIEPEEYPKEYQIEMLTDKELMLSGNNLYYDGYDEQFDMSDLGDILTEIKFRIGHYETEVKQQA